MKILCTSLFFVFYLSTSSFAQFQIRPTQLIDRNDNVLTGYVKYYDWGSNPERIEFSTDSSTNFRSLALYDLRKITIKNGPSYESLYLNVPYYAKNPIKVTEPVIQSVDSTYYLSEILLESELINLYRFLDKDQAVRFVLSKRDSLIVLDNIHVRIIKQETTYDFQEPQYRKKLQAVLYDCPTLNVSNTLYSENSLINLLKQYLSFCRIDSKIYLEQKKIDKIRVGLGVFGSYWQSDKDLTQAVGLNLQLLFPRQFQNIFAMINVGRLQQQSSIISGNYDLFIGLYAGRYVGRRRVQGKFYTGLSTLGMLDTGVGLSYRKLVSIDMRYLILGNLSNSLSDYSFKTMPLLHLSAIIPLNR